MAVLMLTFLTFALVHAYGGIPKSESGNFPLDGCSTKEMDFLFLYSDDFKGTHFCWGQMDLIGELLNVIRGDSNETNQRVVFYEIYDNFSASMFNVNVSTWTLSTSLNDQLRNKCDEHQGKMRHKNNANETIRLKVQFVQRLFHEMGGVRKNVTHVAVIFFDGFSLSFEESRGISEVVQQQITDVKIFVVVLRVRYEKYIIYLIDTFLVGYSSAWFLKNELLMAICRQCSEGWFSLIRDDHIDSMSCYLLVDDSEFTSDWYGAMGSCFYMQSSLATIETKEELTFLRENIFVNLNNQGRHKFESNGSTQSSVKLYIGLFRKTNNFAKRFYWWHEWSFQTRPFVINHWLSGKPSGWDSSGCGVWQFEWNTTINEVANSSSDSRYVDGWADVKCESEISSLSLCEVFLPRKVESKNMLIVKPATNENFSQASAKGELMIFRNNLVSVSANIGSTDFQNIFKQTGQELFPLFDCGGDIPGSRYISYIYVCDSVNHCSNRRDEIFCAERSQEKKKASGELGKTCTRVLCCDGSCLPLQWVNDGEVDCNVCGYSGGSEVNDESEVLNKYLKRNETCAFICNDDQCVCFSQLNDGHPDCTGAEGPIDETIGKLEQAGTCYNILGHIIWAPRCVYVKDRYGAVLGCRDMSHLDNCTDFECPEGYFKCPDTYCIPQHYVLDGDNDCSSREEEISYNIAPCTGNFACWNSKMCLHPDLVCDGHPDCPHEDDEVDCHVSCFEGLRCISGTTTIADYKIFVDLLGLPELKIKARYLDLSRLDMSNAGSPILDRLINLTVIICSHCNINNDNINIFSFSERLQELDLSYNQLQSLDDFESYSFTQETLLYFNLSYNTELTEINHFQSKFLKTLDLCHTNLSFIGKSFFLLLPNLKNLNLSFTKIIQFHNNTFPPNLFYQALDLRGLFITDFYEDFFNGLSISQDLYTDSFELCCPQVRGENIPYYTCHAPEDAISSCFYLLGANVQRSLLWIIAVLAVLGNMTVIGYRVIWEKSVLKTGYGLFVTNLGISDFIMGIYLFIIAGADYYYRDVYVLYDKSWRESVVCKLAGFLATLSYEVSIFFVFLITLDRFLLMKFPFGQIKFSNISKAIALSLSWITGFLLALTPIVFRFEIYSSNAVCLGLPLTAKRLNGWEFSFAVFIVLNFCLFLLIVFGQRTIFRAMSENRRVRIESRRAEDIAVAKQLFLIALSNFLCWFPIGLIGILSLCGHVISNDVYAWTTVIILPINSAANPLLYTIPALMAKWERFIYDGKRTINSSA